MKFRLVETLIVESKVDQENFINKFGKDVFDFFQKYSQRIKNAGISTDIVWHTKNTSIADMQEIISDLENKVVKDKDTGETKLNRNYIGSGNGYEVWQPLNWETSMNMGDGTGWCITGRYQTNEVKPSQAKQYFNEYTNKGIKFYFFMFHGTAEYCIALYPRVLTASRLLKTNFELWDVEDDNVTKDYDRIYLPYDLIPDLYIEKAEDVNGMHILNNRVVDSYEDEEFSNIEVPDGITEIANNAFLNNTALETVKLPESVTTIGERAFANCFGLDKINIPSKVTVLEFEVFRSCGFEFFEVPSNIENISVSAFRGCRILDMVTLNKGLKEIDVAAFFGTPLETVKFKGTLDEFKKIRISRGAFPNRLPLFECDDHKDIKMVILTNGDIMDNETGEILSVGEEVD